MKNFQKRGLAFLLMLVLFGVTLNPLNIVALAHDNQDKKVEINISEDKLISVEQSTNVINGKTITTTISKYEGDITVTDILTISEPNSGPTLYGTGIIATTEATKHMAVEAGSSVALSAYLTATFEFNGSSSKCVSYSSTKYVHPNFTLVTWESSSGYYTFLGIPTGSSYAEVDYYVCMTYNPASFHSGILNIKCSKDGKIS